MMLREGYTQFNSIFHSYLYAYMLQNNLIDGKITLNYSQFPDDFVYT